MIQTYITNHNFGIVCLSETFPNSSIQNNDHKLKIDGYNLTRSDYPSDAKKGAVCIYYKEHIPVIRRDDLRTLDNCLVTDFRSQKRKMLFNLCVPLT